MRAIRCRHVEGEGGRRTREIWLSETAQHWWLSTAERQEKDGTKLDGMVKMGGFPVIVASNISFCSRCRAPEEFLWYGPASLK